MRVVGGGTVLSLEIEPTPLRVIDCAVSLAESVPSSYPRGCVCVFQ